MADAALGNVDGSGPGAGHMRRPTLLENLVENLAGNVPKWSESYLPAPLAHQRLKAMTGRDLGEDAEAWRTWLLDPESAEGFDAG